MSNREGLLPNSPLVCAIASALTLAAVRCWGPAIAEDTMKLTSTAFGENQSIPKEYTCEGTRRRRWLGWCAANAKSLALIVDDPDAPDPAAPQMTWVHWVLYSIPTNASGLAEGAASGGLPKGTLEGINDWHRTGYGGPCPPLGRHRYFHKL
jgi:Raf kinase inhibitor-like YbhB/YbcL family protein